MSYQRMKEGSRNSRKGFRVEGGSKSGVLINLIKSDIELYTIPKTKKLNVKQTKNEGNF